jgi:superfamily II DNA or RNA helicase
MDKYTLTENFIEIIINTDKFDDNDLYIVKNLERLFVIKNTVKIQGHYIVNKHTNYKTDLTDNIRVIQLPKYAGLNLMTKLNLNYVDKRIIPLNDINFNSGIILYENQKKICDDMEKKIKSRNSHSYIYIAQPGSGKCMGYGTKIIMYDGTIKEVQDIKVGDILMGDDSTPRKVLNLGRGVDEMYKISNVKGDEYIVNSEHLLCLKYSLLPKIKDNINRNVYEITWFDCELVKNRYKSYSYKNKNKNDVYNDAVDYKKKYVDININKDIIISVQNYLKLSKNIKYYLKDYKTMINFNQKHIDLDAYFIGLWLGDGNSNKSEISNQDSRILKYLSTHLLKYNCYLNYIAKYDYRFVSFDNKYNYITNKLKEYNLINNKHIPYEYKCNSKENRLKLLAGILDSDGHLDNNCYEIIQKNKLLSDDILYLARSLGFAAYQKECKKSCMYKNEKKEGTYYRIFISGNGLEQIPLLCERKKAKPRQQIKDALRSGITVTPIGIDNYYGFELDGNHKYILDNFIVTHNTITAIELINRLKVKTIIVLPNLLLLNQWKTELLNNLDITDDEILLWCGQSNKKNKKNLTIYNNMFKIILTTVHTSIKIDPNILNENKVYFAIYDEIHLYATQLFSDTFWKGQRYYNLGLTATPNKTNGFEKIFIQHMNQLNYSHDIVPDANKIKFNGNVKIVKNHIKYENILTENGTVSIPLLINKLCEDELRNEMIIKYIIELYDVNEKHCIFIFSDRRNHLINLAELLIQKRNDMTVVIDAKDEDVKVLIGGSKEDDIKDAIDNSRVIFTTYQYSSVGVNIQKMNCMLLTTPRKNNHTQIVGRILRNGSDINITRQIIDIVDCKSILYSQLYERKKVYIENNFKLETIDENKNVE